MSKRKVVRVFAINEGLKPKKPASPVILEILGLGKKTAAPAQDDGDDEPDVFHPVAPTGESAVDTVLNNIFSIPSDCRRVLAFVKHADLTTHYLKKGGEAALANAVDEVAFTDSISNHKEMLDWRAGLVIERIYTPEFDLDNITKPAGTSTNWANRVILLNVKKPIWEEFVNAKDANTKRAALAKALAHRNYAAVLNADAVRSGNLGPMSKVEDRVKFDVKKLVVAYPDRTIIDAAREEQEDKAAGADGEQSAADEAAIKSAAKKVVGQIWKMVGTGSKLKVTDKKFKDTVADLIDNNPVVLQDPHLKGDLIQAVATYPTVTSIAHLLAQAGITAAAPTSAPADASSSSAPSSAPVKSAAVDKAKLVQSINNDDVKAIFDELKKDPVIASEVAKLLAAQGYGQ